MARLDIPIRRSATPGRAREVDQGHADLAEITFTVVSSGQLMSHIPIISLSDINENHAIGMELFLIAQGERRNKFVKTFSKGALVERASYLKYSCSSTDGFSGGLVVDKDGKLVAVHRLADQDRDGYRYGVPATIVKSFLTPRTAPNHPSPHGSVFSRAFSVYH